MPDTIAAPAVEALARPLRLHIGGVEAKPGWKIVNVQDGPNVDYLGDIETVAETFADDSVDELYASHILEHLGYDKALPTTLKHLARILKPGGNFYIAVPDLAALAKLFLHPQADLRVRIHLMRIMFGGRTDPYDVHVAGFDEAILGHFLSQAGFAAMRRVPKFGLFDDASNVAVGNVPVSLNVIATK